MLDASGHGVRFVGDDELPDGLDWAVAVVRGDVLVFVRWSASSRQRLVAEALSVARRRVQRIA